MEPTVVAREPGLTGGARRKVRQPRDSTEHLLADIWAAALGVGQVGIDDDFVALGGDDTRADAMLRAVEAACGARLERADLERAGTIRVLADELKERSLPVLRQRFRTFPARPDATPFFFIHGDVNGAGLYCARLAAALGPGIALHALTPHGPYGPAALGSVAAMADFHLETLRGIQPRGPYLLGGFCHGGIVALEMARRLGAQGEVVPRVILIGPLVWSRYWKLRRFSAWAGKRLGLSEATEARVFLWVRDAVQPWFTRLDRGRARWLGMPTDRLPRADSLRVIARRWARVLTRRTIPKSASEHPADPTGRAAREVRRRKCWTEVVRLSRLHVPGRWNGRLVILWPERERLFRFGDPEASWWRIAPDLEVHTIPGGHNDALVTHVAAAVERIAACLDGALGSSARQPLRSCARR